MRRVKSLTSVRTSWVKPGACAVCEVILEYPRRKQREGKNWKRLFLRRDQKAGTVLQSFGSNCGHCEEVSWFEPQLLSGGERVVSIGEVDSGVQGMSTSLFVRK